jgi:NAD(P)-dependent dehydrogenase (short-subunit alcohol dehydrogenase family)
MLFLVLRVTNDFFVRFAKNIRCVPFFPITSSTMAPNFDLKDYVVAITGGSGGIGYATAQLLLAQGAKVSIADVSEAALKDAVATLGGEKHPGQLHSQVVDVRKPDQVNDWVKNTVERFGKLDGACNLAGVIPKGINVDTVETMPDDDWHFVMDVNLHGGGSCWS